MASGRDVFQYLRDQWEKVLAVASAVGLMAGAGRTLFSKAAPPILWLAIFSVLLLAAGIWMVVQRQKTPAGADAATTGYTRRQIAVAWSLGAVALALCWGVVFRERIKYSETMSRMSHRPLVVISNSLAWQILRYEDVTGEEQYNTLAGEAALLLAGTPYQVVVMNTHGHKATDRDAFVLEGVPEGADLILRAQMILTKDRVRRVIEQLQKPWRPPGSSGAVLMLTPLKRYLRNPFLFSHYRLELPVAAGANPNVRVLLARLALRYAAAMTLYFDGDSAADRAFGEILSLGSLLPAAESPALADVYRSTSYYFANQGADLDRAVAALDLVQRFAPADRSTALAKAFLLISDNQSEKASTILQSAEPDPLHPGALPALKGEYFLRSDEYDSAIVAFTRALKVEREKVYQVPLLTNIALAYAMHTNIEETTRSREMISHLEDAIALEPDEPVIRILQGYAWALADNAGFSGRSFARADSLITEGDSAKRKLYAYWMGRSLLLLKSSTHAVDTLLRLMGPALQSDGELALIFARNLMQIPGREDEAEENLDRALELTPESGVAHRFKAVALVRRVEEDTTSSGRDSLLSAARDHLLKAIEYGEDGAEVRLFLAQVYRESGDTINANKQLARACNLKPDGEDCRFREAERLVAQGDVAGSEQLFHAIWLRDSMDASLPLREALIWYKAGRLSEAERANRRGLRLDPKSFTAHDNLAFILFDLRRVREALDHWEHALLIQPNAPDALAGKAIALAALGRADALPTYARAVQADGKYRDCEEMRREYLWSAHACAAAAKLIAALPPKR